MSAGRSLVRLVARCVYDVEGEVPSGKFEGVFGSGFPGPG